MSSRAAKLQAPATSRHRDSSPAIAVSRGIGISSSSLSGADKTPVDDSPDENRIPFEFKNIPAEQVSIQLHKPGAMPMDILTGLFWFDTTRNIRNEVQKLGFEGICRELAERARPEQWGRGLSTLKDYVAQTLFYILKSDRRGDELIYCYKQTGKVYAVFNTGLVTADYEPLFGTFMQAKGYRVHQRVRDGDWVFMKWCTSAELSVSVRQRPPPKIQYYSTPTQLVFDTAKKIDCNAALLVSECWETLNRLFPETPRAKDSPKEVAVRRLEQEVEKSRARCAYNYRHAVPHVLNGQLQLLFPLYLSKEKLENQDKPDCCLSFRRFATADGDYYYVAITILGLESAYNNARLIAPLERDWLAASAEHHVSTVLSDVSNGTSTKTNSQSPTHDVRRTANVVQK